MVLHTSNFTLLGCNRVWEQPNKAHASDQGRGGAPVISNWNPIIGFDFRHD